MLADDFVVTHKNRVGDYHLNINRNYSEDCLRPNFRKPDLFKADKVPKVPPRAVPDSVCRYCFEEGHWKKECPLLKNKQMRCKGSMRLQNVSSPVLLTDFVRSEICPDEKPFCVVPQDECLPGLNPSYVPFVTEGFVSLPGELKMYL